MARENAEWLAAEGPAREDGDGQGALRRLHDDDAQSLARPDQRRRRHRPPGRRSAGKDRRRPAPGPPARRRRARAWSPEGLRASSVDERRLAVLKPDQGLKRYSGARNGSESGRSLGHVADRVSRPVAQPRQRPRGAPGGTGRRRSSRAVAGTRGRARGAAVAGRPRPARRAVGRAGQGPVHTGPVRRRSSPASADAVVHSWKDLPIVGLTGTHSGRHARARRSSRRAARPARGRRARPSIAQRALVVSAARVANGPVAGAAAAMAVRVHRGAARPRQRPDAAAEARRRRGDALVVAKAALDRLLAPGVRCRCAASAQCLDRCAWMVLPLSEFPTAPAQGALAIEVAVDRDDVIAAVGAINHEPDLRRRGSRARDSRVAWRRLPRGDRRNGARSGLRPRDERARPAAERRCARGMVPDEAGRRERAATDRQRAHLAPPRRAPSRHAPHARRSPSRPAPRTSGSRAPTRCPASFTRLSPT